MSLLINNPGIQTTVQDLGRRGLGRYGLPACGAMDRLALITGNLLLGNKPDCAALETILHGLKIKALKEATLTITGGDLAPHLNARPVEMWTVFKMNPGDILHLKQTQTGFRAYICIQGGIDAPVYSGSRSVYPRGKMGRILRKGDTVNIFPASITFPLQPVKLPAAFYPDYDRESPIQVLPGPQMDHFSRKGKKTFLNSDYTLTSRIDRQGICLKGPSIKHRKNPGIITDPTPQGAIQVPGDGQPIILLRDAQITGGYAKIGVVTRTDLDRLSQAKPGDKIRFRLIDRNEGLRLWSNSKQKLDKLATFLGRETCSSYY